MWMFANFILHILYFLHFGKFHSIVPKPFFTLCSDICNTTHSLYSLHINFSIVLNRLITFLFKLKDRILDNLFVVQFTICFGPSKFTRIVLSLEVTMTLRPTKSECFAIIADKHHTMTRVNWTRTEITLLDSHQQLIIIDMIINNVYDHYL